MNVVLSYRHKVHLNYTEVVLAQRRVYKYVDIAHQVDTISLPVPPLSTCCLGYNMLYFIASAIMWG